MPRSAPIRWGILATGTIAAAFVEDLRLLPDAEVVAVASRSTEAAQVFARRHGIPRWYGSWSELADDSEVDVVYVATPHSAHHAAAALCLLAGKPVLCEKPLTLDLASAEDLVGIARDQGVFLMEAMWMRANPAVRRIAGMVAGGAIGTVTHVYGDFGIQGPFPPGHRMRAPELGGGALLDLGVYPVTFAHLFLGPPDSVQAWARLTDEGTDQNTGLLLGYASGAVATLHCAFVGETGQRAAITGTDGRIEVDRPFYRPERFTVFHATGPNAGEVVEVGEPVRGNGLGYEAEEVMRCLREGLLESPLIPLSDTLEVMRTLDTARVRIGVEYPRTASVRRAGG
ncbi:MAG TPA: Gfo/Idh/MocA family oxidoreductase [Micromonosporaceae bacterium]